MRITVGGDGALDRYAGALAQVPGQFRRQAADGLNEAGDLERTKARRALRDQTGVKRYGAITKRTGSTRATPAKLRYEIKGSGSGMPIREFPVSAGVGRPVTASPWGIAHTFARSFQTSGKGLLLARLGAARLPIRALYGPSVAKEIVKGETASGFEASAAATAERCVVKRLGRLLP